MDDVGAKGVYIISTITRKEAKHGRKHRRLVLRPAWLLRGTSAVLGRFSTGGAPPGIFCSISPVSCGMLPRSRGWNRMEDEPFFRRACARVSARQQVLVACDEQTIGRGRVISRCQAERN
jgi:hypothetical protein